MTEGGDLADAVADPLTARWRPWHRWNARSERIGEVRYGQPSYYTEADTPGDAGLRIRFAFGPLSRPWTCSAVFLRMTFDDPRVEVVDAGIDAAAGTVSVSGLRSNTVGWYLSGLSGTGPGEVLAHVALKLPDDLAELTGTMRAEMPVLRVGLLFGHQAHAHTPYLRDFAVPVSGRAPTGVVLSASATNTNAYTTISPHVTESPAAPHVSQGPDLTASVRLCVAADIERYSRFRTPEAVRAQQRLTTALDRTRRHAGIGGDRVETQESGDGQFVVLPTGLDESEVIPALVHGFQIALAEANADLNERARLRLRIALHRGHLERGANGWAGVSAVGVHRILDSAPARQALSGRPEADFVLIVPDTLYQDVIAHGYGLLRPEAFTSVNVEIPAKQFTDRAWIYVPEPW